MKRLIPLILVFSVSFSLWAEPEYPLTEDSKVQENVPKGELIKFQFDQSKIYPGTTREIAVYVPKQFDGIKPACVYVNQDGVQWNAPVVFDNLIAKGEIPVLIGVFIKPGVVKALDDKTALSRFNRSLEYDGLGPDYSRFILEEVLPAVEKQTTADGRHLVLSSSGNDRAIGGSSSGAICAFTAAWERPDAFSRVFNVVCTMVGLRGANVYPTLIRKYEPKPIRVFQQDGSNDNNIYGGDWWMANQELERSLTFAGYEHDHVWGEGGHNGKHGSAVFPDAMRFLWKGWPEPVKGGVGNNRMLGEILIPDEKWELVWEGKKAPTNLAVNSRGEVFFGVGGEAYKASGEGQSSAVDAPTFQSVGVDGRQYFVEGNKLRAFDGEGKSAVVAKGIKAGGLACAHNGNIYVAEEGDGKRRSNAIWLVKPDGAKQKVDDATICWGGVVLSPDQTLLYASDSESHWVYSYQIQPDGTLAHRQKYYWLHSPDTADDSGAGGMQVDAAGRLYVATRMGVQVCDQAGRVNAILPTPEEGAESLVIGGAEFDTVFVQTGNKIYKRKFKIKGFAGADVPVKPAAPHL